MSDVEIVIDPQSAQLLADDVRRIGQSVRKSLIVGIYREARAYLEKFRATLPGKFKIQKSNLGGAFKVYATEQPGGPVAGIFTRWKAARIYERGGTIIGKGAMAVPINPRAFTADGRVKKKWRDPKNFPDLFQIVTRKGTVLLVQGKKQVTTAVTARRVGVQPGNYRAFAPMFVLLRSTRRSAVLRFTSDFEQHAAGGLRKLDAAIGRAVEGSKPSV